MNICRSVFVCPENLHDGYHCGFLYDLILRSSSASRSGYCRNSHVPLHASDAFLRTLLNRQLWMQMARIPCPCNLLPSNRSLFRIDSLHHHPSLPIREEQIPSRRLRPTWYSHLLHDCLLPAGSQHNHHVLLHLTEYYCRFDHVIDLCKHWLLISLPL